MAAKRRVKIPTGFVEYNAVFVNDWTREKTREKGSNFFTRKYGMVPKSGDFMEMVKHSFSSGSSSYFVPVRQFPGQRDRTDDRAAFKLDMLDVFGAFPISEGRLYDDFREFNLDRDAEEKLEEENVPGHCKMVLVGDDLSLRYEETRLFRTDMGKTGLYNFFPGQKPFHENHHREEHFSSLMDVPVNALMVRAVLHPLYGLPKVLLQEVGE